MSTTNPYQGDTIYYSVVIDGAEDITGTGQLTYKQKRGVPVEKSGTLSAGTFSTTFTSTETAAMLGRYEIQVKIKDTLTGNKKTVFTGSLTIEESDMADFDG